MTTKTYYYHFHKFDKTFIAALFGLGLLIYTQFCCPIIWILSVMLVLIWIYKNILKQPAVIITDKDIKIDHSNPLPWKDIKDGEIKIVNLCGRKMKVLSLNPKKGIKYHYNYLQKHNADFGPFPIPLYGILTPKDEKAIIQAVKKHIKIS